MNTTELEATAKKIATTSTIALDRDYVSRSHAMNVSITVDGPVVIKHGRVVVPINIFHFSSFRSVQYKIVIDRFKLTVIDRFRI